MEFKVLGPLEVVADRGSVEIAAPKHRAVLAILLIERNRVVSLDQLVDRLYAGDPPPRAAGSVHAYVSHLRRLLEPDRPHRAPCRLLVSRAPGYQLVVDHDAYDVARFEAATRLALTELSAGRAAAALAQLDAALELWRGPALADFAYQPFARSEAGRLEALRIAALESQVDARLALGGHAAVVAEVEKLVDEHPLRERLWAGLVLALYRCGRQGDALRAYERCRLVLRDELGIQPGPALRQLQADVLAQAPILDRYAPVAGASLPTRSPPEQKPAVGSAEEPRSGDEPARSPLVGRDRELAVLRSAVAGARAGRGGIALVAGEAGIGKTSLVERLEETGSGGELFAWGHGHDGGGAPGFWTWSQIFRQLSMSAGSEVDDVLRRTGVPRARLAAVVPEWATDEQTAPPSLDPAAARFRLYQDMVTVLVALSVVQPVVLVLDDLQWADSASLRLLEFVAPRVRSARILVLGTYREDEVMHGHPLAETLGALARVPSVVRVSPGPLTAADIGAYVQAVAGVEVTDKTAGAIRARTNGNPFFVNELVRLLVSEGHLGDPSAIGADHVPAGVRDVIRRRLARLPEQTNALLSIAAVIGNDFDLATLEAVSRLDSGETEDAVDVALVSGLVADDAGTPGRYRFSHALVRDTIYASVGAVRRARLHANVGAALEARGDVDSHLAQLAHHFALAAPVLGPAEGVAYLTRAAGSAQTALAYEAAEDHLRSALALLEHLPAGTDRDRRELHLQNLLASSLTVAGGFASDAAGAAWDRALQLCVAVGDTGEVLMSQAGLAIFLVAQGRLDASGALTQRILRLGEATGDVRCLVTARFGLGFRAWLLGDLTQAAAELAEVERLCDGDILAYGDVFPWYDPGVISLAVSGLVRWLAGDENEGRRRLEDAVAAARRSGHPFKLAMILYYDAIRSIMANDSEGALRRSEELDSLAGAHGLGEMVLVATVVRGWARACDGDASGALDDVRRSCLLRGATGMKLLTPFLLALLADVCRRAGRRDEASAALDEALAIAAESGERFYEAELQRARGELLAEQGPDQAPAARECFRLAASAARAQGAVPFERRALAAAARLGS